MKNPVTSDVVELLRCAVEQGHITLVLPGQRPPDHLLTSSHDLALAVALRRQFGLRPAESRALMALAKREHISRQELHVALSRDGNPVSGIRSVDVIICNLRGKLKPHGIEIATVWGLGFRLAEDERDKIHKMIASYGAKVIAAAAPARPTKPEAA
jgi:DNA-binding winged helix-turn-helix (wHTH) protein